MSKFFFRNGTAYTYQRAACFPLKCCCQRTKPTLQNSITATIRVRLKTSLQRTNISIETSSIVFIMIFTLLSINNFAQVNQPNTINAELDGLGYLNQRIKQIDEFIDRFNDTLQPIENLIDKHFAFKDTLQYQEFIKQAQQSKLSFFDTTWCAQLKVEVLYKGATHDANLYLKVQAYPKDQSSKWVISGVEANFLNLEPECVDSTTLIPPSANGTNFIALEKVWRNQSNIAAYTSDAFQADQLSIFLFLIKNGDLTLKSINQQDYYFWQMPDFVFQCQYFNRPAANSGWLITAIEPKIVSNNIIKY